MHMVLTEERASDLNSCSDQEDSADTMAFLAY